MNRLYFAYGSNMSVAQMARRCPGARARGAAVLRDWRFNITTRGSASIVPQPGGTVHGVLWRVNPAHVHTLDLYEGVAIRNYLRRAVVVEDLEGRQRHALTYVGTRLRSGRARIDYMHTAVLPGARRFDLPADYIDHLHEWLPDRAIGERKRVYVGRKARRR